MDNISYITKYIEESIAVKKSVLASEILLAEISKVADVCVNAIKAGNKVFFAGNGGSAADAQHLAAEFVSRFNYDRPGMSGIALTTDSSIITAIGNDYGYEKLFERQILALGRAGDVFVGITTSGNSLNILNAIDAAKRIGVKTVGMCGGGGKIHNMTDFLLSVPSNVTPHIQEAHIAIGHILCAIVERNIYPKDE